MKNLKIAATAEVEKFIPDGWKSELLSNTSLPAELAAVVISARATLPPVFAKKLAASGLTVPVIRVKPQVKSAKMRAEINRKAAAYEQENVPQFLNDLITYARAHPVSFTTPGHHNGQFYALHPAGKVFKDFMGENFFLSDVSDTVTELGDTLTHGGSPLAAQQQAARAYHADKVYFVTDGTTCANTICATAALTAGDLVLFDRNNHKSLYNSALVETGAIPIYLPTDRNALGAIGEIDERALDEQQLRAQVKKVAPAKATQQRPFRLAVIQLETYDGVLYDAQRLVKEIGHLCDYILFDCAWGGYEQFLPMLRPLSPFSLKLSAQAPGILVTQSIHKQQAGLAQASQILKKDRHLKGQPRYIDHKHFNHAYLKYVTTSYSYPIYASLTVNAALAANNFSAVVWQRALRLGIEWRKQLLQSAHFFKPFVPAKINGIPWEQIPTEELATQRTAWQLNAQAKWHGFREVVDGQVLQDPLKLIITTPGVDVAAAQYQTDGIPAPIVEQFLTERRIMCAKADLNSLLFLLTPGESQAKLARLLSALLEFEKLYQANATVEEVLPRLFKEHQKFYAGWTMQKLCSNMQLYYRQHQTFALQKVLFESRNLQDFVLSPAKADAEFVRNNCELIPLENAVGRVALEGALPYPPGIFVVAPGERWQEKEIAYFEVLLGAMSAFPGFAAEIQGVYPEKTATGRYKAKVIVLKEQH